MFNRLILFSCLERIAGMLGLRKAEPEASSEVIFILSGLEHSQGQGVSQRVLFSPFNRQLLL
jgi:hypothetical protein